MRAAQIGLWAAAGLALAISLAATGAPPASAQSADALEFARANSCPKLAAFLERFPQSAFAEQARAAQRTRNCADPQADLRRAQAEAAEAKARAKQLEEELERTRQARLEAERKARAAPVPPPPTVTPAGVVDARQASAAVRAPIVSDPAGLPAFALFRECDICPEMVVMPAGSFVMGSPATEAGRWEDEDDREGAGGAPITVSVRRFAISRFEVTWDDWTACAAAGFCTEPASDFAWGRGRRPVLGISWFDAARYVDFINSRARGGYRRLSEAEWEFAARAGTTTRFHWGDRAPVCTLGAFGGANVEGCFGRTQPVGSYPANAWGLFDMHGNIDEWVEDCDNNHLGQTPRNGEPVRASACGTRVLRSGAYAFRADWNRSALRDGYAPTGKLDWFGFRIGRSL